MLMWKSRCFLSFGYHFKKAGYEDNEYARQFVKACIILLTILDYRVRQLL